MHVLHTNRIIHNHVLAHRDGTPVDDEIAGRREDLKAIRARGDFEEETAPNVGCGASDDYFGERGVSELHDETFDVATNTRDLTPEARRRQEFVEDNEERVDEGKESILESWICNEYDNDSDESRPEKYLKPLDD